MSPVKAEWIPEAHAQKIIRDAHHGLVDAHEILHDALMAGTVTARKSRNFGPPYTELVPRYWEQERPSTPHARYEMRAADVLALLKQSGAEAPQRGRPPKHDWDAFWIQAVLLANTPDGLPEKQAEFEQRMASLYDEFDIVAPGESLIREKAGKLYRALKAGK